MSTKTILIEVEVPEKSFEVFTADDIAHAFFNGFRFGDDKRVKYRIINPIAGGEQGEVCGKCGGTCKWTLDQVHWNDCDKCGATGRVKSTKRPVVQPIGEAVAELTIYHFADSGTSATSFNTLINVADFDEGKYLLYTHPITDGSAREEKTIKLQWVEEQEWGYGKAMRVIESTHPRFSKGTRFDFGFFNIATDEGYTIISLPMAAPPQNEAQE